MWQRVSNVYNTKVYNAHRIQVDRNFLFNKKKAIVLFKFELVLHYKKTRRIPTEVPTD